MQKSWRDVKISWEDEVGEEIIARMRDILEEVQKEMAYNQRKERCDLIHFPSVVGIEI